jgi:hypothetical protein
MFSRILFFGLRTILALVSVAPNVFAPLSSFAVVENGRDLEKQARIFLNLINIQQKRALG